jgi:hypothetical protein
MLAFPIDLGGMGIHIRRKPGGRKTRKPLNSPK